MSQLGIALIMLACVALAGAAIYLGYATTQQAGAGLFGLYAAHLLWRYIRRRT